MISGFTSIDIVRLDFNDLKKFPKKDQIKLAKAIPATLKKIMIRIQTPSDNTIDSFVKELQSKDITEGIYLDFPNTKLTSAVMNFLFHYTKIEYTTIKFAKIDKNVKPNVLKQMDALQNLHRLNFTIYKSQAINTEFLYLMEPVFCSLENIETLELCFIDSYFTSQALDSLVHSLS
mmetsp:Transcript_33987/g.30764  ORF Transcript_33987/g.30764 Transcript_33987/m.30764 type:complete len:176 (-) Transcript_33987:586-1113(-)